jgi:ribonuclease T1
MKKILTLVVLSLFVLSFFTGCGGAKQSTPGAKAQANTSQDQQISETGTYTSKDQVAAYLHKYHKLPANYITKNKARELGWPKKGTLDKVAPGKSIGGDHFGNFDHKLPTDKGIRYTECDIDYVKGSRGAKRIVFDNKGHIYYCGDHYNTFEKLY